MILSNRSEKGINLDRLLDDLIKSGNLSSLLIIVPTNRRLRSLKKELISYSPNQTVNIINIETLGTLTKKLLALEKNFADLTEESAAVLLKQCTHEIELNYFKNYRNEIPAGTLDRIRNVISKYKENGISPDDLNTESQSLTGSEKLKAEDIEGLYRKYMEKTEQLNIYEPGDIYRHLIKFSFGKIHELFHSTYNSVNTVVVHGFDEFTNPEIEILSSIAKYPAFKFYISFDYYQYNPLIFNHLDKCFHKLQSQGFVKINDLSPPGSAKFQKIIQERLFVDKAENMYDDQNYAINIISAKDRADEIKTIAKKIKELIAVQKKDPSGICVAFNLIANYPALVRDIFGAYGIPYNLTDRIALSSTIPVTVIAGLLEIVEKEFNYKTIVRTLSNHYTHKLDIDVTNLLTVANELRVVSGYERWIDSVKYELDNLPGIEADEIDILRKGKRLKKALHDLQSLHDFLLPFTGKLTINEFENNINRLILDLGIYESLVSNINEETERNIKSLVVFNETLNEIFYLLKSQYGDKKFPLNFFLDQIRTSCSRARFNVKEKSDYGVLVTTINEIRGLKFDYLFLGGLIDGDFPTRYSPEIFFSGSFIKQEQIHQSEERYHFYQALCTWDKGLYLTYPQGESSKEYIESSFIKDFKKLFKCGLIIPGEFINKIYSIEELLINFSGIDDDNTLKTFPGFGENYVNDIKRKIEIELSRTGDPFGESVFKGFLLSDEMPQENINSYLEQLKDKQYSISELELYAKCPFKYFLERVLRVETVEEPSEEIEAVEIGSLLHSILFRFYVQLRSEGITLQGCDEQSFLKAKEMLFNIAHDKTGEIQKKLPFAFYDFEKILGIGGKEENSILYKFLCYEKENTDEFRPSFFEATFGSAVKTSSDEELIFNEPVNINGINIRGKIDRIDLDENESKFNILDYKLSGKKPTQADIEAGISLQLPLYMFAAKSLLKYKFDREFTPNLMYIYSLKYSGKEFGKQKISLTRKKNVDINELNNMIIAGAVESIKKITGSIQTGKFHLSPLKDREAKVCRYCQFKSVCRIEEVM